MALKRAGCDSSVKYRRPVYWWVLARWALGRFRWPGFLAIRRVAGMVKMPFDDVTVLAFFPESVFAKNLSNSAAFSSDVFACQAVCDTWKRWNGCRDCTRHGEGLSSVTGPPCTAGRQAPANAADAMQSIVSFSRWLTDSAALLFHCRLTHGCCCRGSKTKVRRAGSTWHRKCSAVPGLVTL